ncbi:MAG: DMT family transporter [Alphaproteobacteria bacterium]|nr:DMT family transporter [Alphaproteobacteria bacterium]MCW5740951.1 DMT family transporter [Alphaproteobacteria bacterium]
MGATEWLLLGTLSVLWGGSFLFGKIALAELPPLTIVLARVGLAGAALWLAVVVTRLQVPRERAVWLAFFAMGLINNLIPFSLIMWGQVRIGSGLASILNATTPLWTVLVAHVFTADEKLDARKLAGALTGVAGVAVMIGPMALAGLGGDVAAQLAVIAATLSYAFAGLYGRRFARQGVKPLVVAAGQVGATTVMLLPVALLVDAPWNLAMPGPRTVAALCGLALLSTALGYVLYFRILATAGATNVLLVTFLIPVSGVLMGVLVLDETIEPRQLAGMALIGLGLAAIDGRLLRRAS